MRVLPFKEMQERMITFLKEDIPLLSCGFDNIDDNWKFMQGNCTDIIGYPYMGKTLILIEKLFNLSQKYGKKHLLHLPDSGKPEEVMATLIHKLTGKTFDKRYPNRINEFEMMDVLNWIDKHFKILDDVDEKTGKLLRPTPKEFWEYCATLDVDTGSIDSWNYMKHEGSGHEYLADVLSYRNQIAEKSKKHFFTIVHPKNPTAMDFDKDGVLKPPNVYNIMGGSEWNNNGKNIIAVHKDDKESQEYDIYYRKIKPRIVGKTGMITLSQDLTLAKFYILRGSMRLYAYGEELEVKEEAIRPDGGMEINYFNPKTGDYIPQIEDPNEDIPF